MFEAGVSGPLYEGARVQTAKGPGTVHKIATEVIWNDGARVRKSMVVVQLDDRPPSAMRSVFYADRVQLLDTDVEVEVEVVDAGGYELDDPKHPTYHDRYADQADQARKAEKEDGP